MNAKILLATALTLAAATSLAAAELPKRKPGLWEIDTRVAGMPALGTVRQCIDEKTDDLMMQRARKDGSDCSVLDVRSQGQQVSVRSVCKVQGSVASSEAVFRGSFEKSYAGEINTRYQPALMGMSETRLTQEGRWAGLCPAGMKPGEVVMPDNDALNQIMKDPRIQEMMKRPR